jgi:hypothetical protein
MVIKVEPISDDDGIVSLEFVNGKIVIDSDIMPIVCSPEQAKEIGEIISNPQKYFMDQ